MNKTRFSTLLQGKNYGLFYMSKVRTFLHDVIVTKVRNFFHQEKTTYFLHDRGPRVGGGGGRKSIRP